MWRFCLASLLREYGWLFIRHIAVPHPFKTIKALLHSVFLDVSSGIVKTATAPLSCSRTSIVGVGFCLKPLNPPCPSERANHNCCYLENLAFSVGHDIPSPCRKCTIRHIGTMALKKGISFYIMTSAKEILLDVFYPAINKRSFSSGLFLLCRYSLRPFAVGMSAANIKGWMFPFEQGDCRDYKTWLAADIGIKNEQTEINNKILTEIVNILEINDESQPLNINVKRFGNIFTSHIKNKNTSEKMGPSNAVESFK